MEPILENLQSLAGLLPRITLTGFIEIAIISLMVYAFLNWVRDTEAWVLLRGLFMIFAFVVFCAFLQLDTILWILGRIATIAVIALVIIFQPELRRALQQLGTSGFFAVSGLAGYFRFLCRERTSGRMEGEPRFFGGDSDPPGGGLLQDGES